MYPRSTNCPLIEQQSRWRKKIIKSKEYEDEVRKIMDPSKFESQEMFEKIARTPFGELCNNLSLLQAHGFPYPKGVEDHHVEKVCALSGKMFQESYSSPYFLRVGIGEFLSEILDSLKSKALADQRKIKPKDHAKFVVAAGHDTTLAPLLLSLGIFDGFHPPMASSLGVELWKGKDVEPNPQANGFDGYYIKLMYNFKEIPIPACDNKLYCPLDEFIKLSEDRIPKDYFEDCKVEMK